jgi:hypothetical protein
MMLVKWLSWIEAVVVGPVDGRGLRGLGLTGGLAVFLSEFE